MLENNNEKDNRDLETIYSILRNNVKNQKVNEILEEQFSELNKKQLKNYIKYIPFNEKANWSYSDFSTTINKNNIEYPEILNNEWNLICPNVDNGMEITNKIFVSEENINYKIVNNLIKANILLQGDGMFWIFLHCNHTFDGKTIVILFSKKKFCRRVTMSLGSFVKYDNLNNSEEKGNNFFIFQKQQLIKSYKIQKYPKENDKFEMNDTCLIKIKIKDEGFDTIKINAKLNDGEEENELIGRIYEQVAIFDSLEQINKDDEEKSYRIMIAGNGQSCKVNNFFCETSLKKNIENYNPDMVEGCECCEII